MRIGIAGIAGRMGRLLVEEVAAAGASLSGGTQRGEDARALFTASDVVIDFTHAHAAATHAALAAETGRGLVLGSSGLSAAEEAAVAEAARHTPIVYAANFAAGVNLVIALAERLAAALPGAQYDAEIVEMHHRQKVDAPSGTALMLGDAAASGRGVELGKAAVRTRDGMVGARKEGTIGFATLRGGDVVGDHAVMFAGTGEQITLSHRATSREIFALGGLRAVLWAATKPAGFYTMRDVVA